MTTNTNSMIMSMTAQTSIHAGAGQALSVIDLPIQREGHTQHPVIFGSSLKGALRYRASQTLTDNEKLMAVFGPDTQNAQSNAHAGAIMVSDAKLLLLPVRSLNGYFKWVTCPALLRRYIKDNQRAGIHTDNLTVSEALDKLTQDSVAIADEVATHTLFLEEFAMTANTEATLSAWVERLAEDTGIDKDALTKQMVVVSDDMFSYLAQNSTPVNAHIALDENKTVKKGALWYEETLPAETVMYSLIMSTSSRRKGQEISATDISQILTDEVLPVDNRFLQVGGNETVGMGWFAVNFISEDKISQDKA